MGKAVNYNDIAEIIRSSIDIVELVSDYAAGTNIGKISKSAIKQLGENIADMLDIVKNINKRVQNLEKDRFITLNAIVSSMADMIKTINSIDTPSIKALININKFNAILISLKDVFKSLKKLSKRAKKIDSEKVVEVVTSMGAMAKAINDIPTMSPMALINIALFGSLVAMLSMVSVQLAVLIPVLVMGSVGTTLVRKMAVNISLAVSAIKDACKDFLKLLMLCFSIRAVGKTTDINDLVTFLVEQVFPAIKKIFGSVLKTFPKMNIVKYILVKKRIWRWGDIMQIVMETIISMVKLVITMFAVSKIIVKSGGARALVVTRAYIRGLLGFIEGLKVSIKIRIKIWLIKTVITSLKSLFFDILMLFGALWLFNRFSSFFSKQLNKFKGVVMEIVGFFDSIANGIKSFKDIFVITLKITLICTAVGGIMLLVHEINKEISENNRVGVEILSRFVSELSKMINSIMGYKDVKYKDILKIAIIFVAISGVLYTLYMLIQRLNKFDATNISVLATFINALTNVANAVVSVQRYNYKEVLIGISKVMIIAASLLPMMLMVIAISKIVEKLGGTNFSQETIDKMTRVVRMVARINALVIGMAERSARNSDANTIKMYKLICITLVALVPVALLTVLLAGPATIASVSTIPVILFLLGIIPMLWSMEKMLKIVRRFKIVPGVSAKVKYICSVLKYITIMGLYIGVLNLVRPSIINTILTITFVALLIPFLYVIKLFLIVLKSLKISGKSERKQIRAIGRIIKGLGVIAAILTSMSVLAIGAMVGIIYTTMFLVALILFLLVVKFFFWLVSIILKNDVSRGIKKILGLLGLLSLIALALFGIGVLSLLVVPMAGSIGLFMLMIVATIVILVALGYLVVTMSAVIAPAIVGLEVILILVGIIFLIGLALWAIASFELDAELIMKNVRTVFDIVDQIVDEIFFGNKKEDPTKSTGGDRSFGDFIVDILGATVRPIIQIIGFILAVPTLLLAFICIGLILAIATALRLLQALDLDPSKILANVGTVFDTVDQIVQRIFFGEEKEDPTKSTGGDRSFGDFIVDMLGSTIKSMFKIIGLILAVPTLLLAFICVGIILAIATALRLLQELNLDPGTIATNVGTVMDCADAVTSAIFSSGKEEPEQKDKPWYEGLWDFVKGGIMSVVSMGKNAVGAVMAIPYLLLILISTGLVKRIVDILNEIGKFDFKEKQISAKVEEVVKCANAVIDNIFSNDVLSNVTNSDNYKLRRIITCFTSFSNLTKMVGSMDSNMVVGAIRNLKNMQSVNHNALYILSYIQKQTYNYDTITRTLDLLERFNEVTKDFVDVDSDDVRRSKELTDNYIKYIDKINGIDLENLKTTERLFANMAKFSESINGDFDKLAESLNERIAPLLEELKNLMSQMPSHINKASSDQQKTAIDLANNNVTQNTYNRAGMSTKEQQETTHKNEKLTQSQYDSLNNIEKIVKILEGNDVNGGVKISRSR